MAGFKTHLAGGIVVGGASAASVFSLDGPFLLHLIYLFSLGTIGGILPDLDSDTGRPIKLLFALVSTLLTCIIIITLLSKGTSFSSIIFSICIMYVAVLFLFFVGKKFTAHRGIMHSVPFALLAGVVAALCATAWGERISLLAGLTAFSGVMTHLFLDEINSVGIRFCFIPYFKSSFGSALKLTGKSLSATFALYGILTVVSATYLIVI